MPDTIGSPEIDLPIAKGILDLAFWKLDVDIISLNPTISLLLFGTSIPTWLLPGIGAKILIPLVARDKARSSDKFNILLTFTPLCGFSS